jgi:hypothetical protein
MQVAYLSTVVYGVLDPHRFDVEADPDLDLTFHFDAVQIRIRVQDRILPQCLHVWEYQKFKGTVA